MTAAFVLGRLAFGSRQDLRLSWLIPLSQDLRLVEVDSTLSLSVVTCPVHILNEPSEGVGSLRSNKVHALFCLEINLKVTKYSSLRRFYMSTPLRASPINSKKYFPDCIRIGTSLKTLNPKR
jgi:hypothetical protein